MCATAKEKRQAKTTYDRKRLNDIKKDPTRYAVFREKRNNYIPPANCFAGKPEYLDRFPDQNGNYEPRNCRWATPKQQQNNMRRNVLISWRGVTKTIPEWAEVLGMKIGTLACRISQGWTIDRAMTAEVQRRDY